MTQNTQEDLIKYAVHLEELIKKNTMIDSDDIRKVRKDFLRPSTKVLLEMSGN